MKLQHDTGPTQGRGRDGEGWSRFQQTRSTSCSASTAAGCPEAEGAACGLRTHDLSHVSPPLRSCSPTQDANEGREEGRGKRRPEVPSPPAPLRSPGETAAEKGEASAELWHLPSVACRVQKRSLECPRVAWQPMKAVCYHVINTI